MCVPREKKKKKKRKGLDHRGPIASETSNLISPRRCTDTTPLTGRSTDRREAPTICTARVVLRRLHRRPGRFLLKPARTVPVLSGTRNTPPSFFPYKSDGSGTRRKRKITAKRETRRACAAQISRNSRIRVYTCNRS